MGHGDHWRCILPDLDNGIAKALGWVPRGPVVGHREAPAFRLPGGGVGATVSVITWPATGLRATFVVVRDSQIGRSYLHTAFPAASAGCQHKIRIDSVCEASCGLEARISGTLGDAGVTFFDPLYALNRGRYLAGTLADVELAGIAYSLRIVPPETKLRSVVGDVLLEGAAVLISADPRDKDQANRDSGDVNAFGVSFIVEPFSFPLPDDYQFCVQVKHVEISELDTIPVWKFRATALRVYDGREDIEIDIYVTREGLPDAVVPAPGDQVWGTLWLQGTLALQGPLPFQ